MNYNQKLIIGVDIAKSKHDFHGFLSWIQQLIETHDMD